jgi:hypothetical protein
MEPWRVGRPTVADSHHLDEKPDPNPIIIDCHNNPSNFEYLYLWSTVFPDITPQKSLKMLTCYNYLN